MPDVSLSTEGVWEELRANIRQTLERQAVYRERQYARSQVLSKITESAPAKRTQIPMS